jgi:hypothetical protein
MDLIRDVNRPRIRLSANSMCLKRGRVTNSGRMAGLGWKAVNRRAIAIAPKGGTPDPRASPRWKASAGF